LEFDRRPDVNVVSFPTAPAAQRMPGVLVCIPLGHTSETERGTDDWATQGLRAHCPGLRCTEEDTLVSLTSDDTIRSELYK